MQMTRCFRTILWTASTLFLLEPLATARGLFNARHKTGAFARAASLRSSRSVQSRSGVEIETPMTPGILRASTTADGTIGPLLKPEHLSKLPAFITTLARDKGVNPGQLRWESLDDTQKLELLKVTSQGQSFWASRNIPGVTFKGEVAKPTDSRLRLQGKTYGPGTTEIKTEGFLQPEIQFASPVSGVAGVEMHLRSKGSASAAVRDAFRVSRLLGSPATHAHQHLISTLPAKVQRGDAFETLRLVDFYRRANLVGELRSVLAGYPLAQRQDGHGAIYFDFLKSEFLSKLNGQLLSNAGKTPQVTEGLKVAAIGFRPAKTYDKVDSSSTFGFEVRTINQKNQSPRELKEYLDSVQRGLTTGSYGGSRRELRAWYKSEVQAAPTDYLAKVEHAVNPRGYVAKKQGQVLAGLHYNRPVKSLLLEAPAALQGLVTAGVKNNLQSWESQNYGLKMLVHDWSRDPVIAKQPRLVKQVLKAQQAGLQALGALRGNDLEKSFTVVRQFVKDSGLYQAYGTSIGMSAGLTRKIASDARPDATVAFKQIETAVK